MSFANDQAFSIANVNNLFKTKYGKLSENVYNSANVMLGRQIKKYDFTGKNMFVPVPVGFGGGVGSGSLPETNHSPVEDATITAKKVYSRILLDREAMKAASNDEGSFVRATKWKVQKGVESYMRNASRILFGDGTGALGTIDGVPVDNGGGNYDIVISAATWKEANWEEQDYVNMGSSTDIFEVQEVIPATMTIVVQRLSGATVPADTDVVYMQKSKDNDPQGFHGVFEFSAAATGSLYGIDYSRRWSSVVEDALGAGITTDAMNAKMLEIERRCGKVPNLIVASYTQYRKILNLLESQKQYIIEPRMAELKGKISFNAVSFMSTAGAVPIVVDRFMRPGDLYFINDNYYECKHRPGHGWFDEDGTVLLRSSTEDAYEARYGGYYENYIVPSFHGRLSNLAV